MPTEPHKTSPVGEFSGKIESVETCLAVLESALKLCETDSQHAWISDYHPGGIQVMGAMDEIKSFAYTAFERLDEDHDGFLDKRELEHCFASLNPLLRERSFVMFLLCHLAEIAAAFAEECITRSDGISRSDLDAYFDRYHKKYT